MTYNEIFSLYYKEGIPLADIRTVFDYVFHFPFSGLGIHGDMDQISSKEAINILNKLKVGYPAVYLSGYDIIRGNKIYLNENVLIPRTETIEFLYDYVKNNQDWNQKKILDLCTGSGFIAISLKSLFPEAEIHASDISDNALALAEKSAKENKKEIKFIKSDFLYNIDYIYDVIISNPPYIEEDSCEVNAPFEPSLALFSGKDGCDSYRKIFPLLNSHLSSHGLAFFELESTNAKKVATLLDDLTSNSFDEEIIYDMEGKPRYLKAKKKN